MSQDNKQAALEWIVELLNSRNVPFAICGGLAAISYGSNRSLNDIDLFVPAQYFRQAVEAGRAYISKPAQHYCEASEGWDLEYVQFIYKGVKIEIGNTAGMKIFDRRQQCWVPLNVHFGELVPGRVFGVEIPVIPKQALIAYKSVLRRDVDLADINAIQ
ncbi:hypothetical protein ACWJJH_04160 [Endozoicomonadaceae bacterium StTr2]